MFRYRFFIAAILSVLPIYLGCENSPLSVAPSIRTGARVEVKKQQLSSAGGVIAISSSDSSVNGLSISVPTNAYSESRTFTISASPILSHDIGQYIHPLSPLIRISNGGGYADSAMTLTIPVRVPDGHFAMAFMFDAATGELEGLPLAASTPTSLTVLTKHFSHSSHTDLGKGILVQSEDVDFSDIIVSSVDTAVLMQNFMTPFTPGVDDWQFTNWGSIVSNGHCSGQTIGMLWYYSQKKLKGSPQLYGRFDNDGVNKTPNLWQDDVQGYKFCGREQLDWSYSWSNNILEKWQGKNDLRTLRAFSYALRVTNQPQLVVIFLPNGQSPHAMLIYGITRGTLHVCDPNYPGKRDRDIEWDANNGIYLPYFTGIHAGDPGANYTIVHYLAKTAVASWTSAANHWREVANGTIGNDVFPSYTLVALNDRDEFVPLTNGFTVPEGGRLTLNVRGSGFAGTFEVFKKSQDKYTKDGSSVQLDSGTKRIGVLIESTANQWVDFKWFDIVTAEGSSSEPDYGPIRLNLTVDGISKTIQSAEFEYSLYRVIKAKGAFPNELRVSPGDEKWKVGTFVLPASSNNTWVEGSTIYFASKPGSLKITSWSKTKADGAFSFEATDPSSSKTVLVEGDFHYPF